MIQSCNDPTRKNRASNTNYMNPEQPQFEMAQIWNALNSKLTQTWMTRSQNWPELKWLENLEPKVTKTKT